MMEDLSLHILDLAENALNAGATRIGIAITENIPGDRLTIRVSDNGRGMSAPDRRRALDPFFTTQKKRTGLGLSLLTQAARQCGGDVALVTTPGRGTRVTARFLHAHIDRQPLTKMAETIMILVLGNPEVVFRYRHRRNDRVFTLTSDRFTGGRGLGIPDHPRVIGALQQTLRAGLARIGVQPNPKKKVAGRR